MVKTCNQCGVEKDLESFRKSPASKCGYRGECKACASENTKQLKLGNHRQRTPKDVEREKERKRKWDVAHRERTNERNRQRYSKNPEKARLRSKFYREANAERYLALTQARRTRIAGNGGRFTAEVWREWCDLFGNQCVCCGRTDVKLTRDHVLPVTKGGNSNIENMQPLCKSCNSSKNNKHIDYRPGAYANLYLS